MADLIDVPNVAGVPPLSSYAPLVDLALMTRDLVTGYGTGAGEPIWGLYLGGAPVIFADIVTAMGFQVEWAIAKYPIEDGGFESYDKVDLPFRCHLQFVSGINNSNRQALLRSLDAATAHENLTKYDVVTPEITYSGVNIERVSYDRKAAQGLGLLIIDVFVQEIREQSNPNQAAQVSSGNAPQEDGNVQPQSAVSSSVDESGFVSAFQNYYPENAL